MHLALDAENWDSAKLDHDARPPPAFARGRLVKWVFKGFSPPTPTT